MIQPRLGRFDLLMIIVSLVIGIGIFRTPAIVAQQAGGPTIFFAAWILGGLISVCGALTFSEIGARLPVAGGFYKVFSHCYHPAYAFMLNWSLVIINAASATGVAIVGAEYIIPVLLPAAMQNETGIRMVAVAVLVVLAALNFAGIRTGARTQNVLSVLKIVLILVFCSAVFAGDSSSPGILSEHEPVTAANGASALGVCLIAVFFTFGGYQNTVNYGADIRQARKNIPLGIIGGMGIVIALYLVLNLAYYKVLGFEGIKTSPLLASSLAERLFGAYGFKITSLVIFISILGFINTSLINNPRIYFAMAEDRMLPPVFMKVNSRTMVQEFSLFFFTVLMLTSLFMLGTFEKIINYVMFIDSLALASAAFAIFILRRRDPRFSGYKMKGYPVVPAVFIIVLLFVTLSVFRSDPRSALYGLAIFVTGFPLYHLLKRVFRNTKS